MLQPLSEESNRVEAMNFYHVCASLPPTDIPSQATKYIKMVDRKRTLNQEMTRRTADFISVPSTNQNEWDGGGGRKQLCFCLIEK